jgi:hypothetical protein
MTAIRIDKGRKLASIRTVRSHIPRTYRIDLYEHWVEIGPGGKNVTCVASSSNTDICSIQPWEGRRMSRITVTISGDGTRWVTNPG